MKRREFSACAAGLLAFGATVLPGLARGQVQPPKDGTEYRSLDARAATDAPTGKIEVVEFFWYSCPHCNAFEPQLDAWSKKLPADVVLRRVPVAFNDSFVPQQRLFYTLEAMGRLEDLHRKVFQAIHTDRQALNREELIMAWADKQGLDKAKFKELYNSFTVQTKTRRASQLQSAFQVEGVPALGIAGRWYTDGTMARNMGRALQVTEYLIGEARKSR